MGMSRRKVREQIFKLLFQVEFQGRDEMEAQAGLFFAEEEPAVEEEQKEEILGKLSKIINCLDELDEKLGDAVTGWSLKRVGKVELAILRLALYEILYDEEVPDSVAINEAVELAKKYGPEEASGFINGVLAKLVM